MKLLVIGGGGREHALTWAAARSPLRPRIYALPGNPGIAAVAERLPGSASDADAVATAVREHGIDLVLVGPEAPLVAGLADRLTAEGVRVFGPSAAAAAIEGSKVFAKALMRRYGIPTAEYEIASDPQAAFALTARFPLPHVIKADGLAAGKGALIIRDRAEAQAAVTAMMVERRFGEAGAQLVFEEFMEGEEASIFAIACGERYVLLPPAQDYKRALDGDRGGNTGGMGAYAPIVTWEPRLEARVRSEVIEPTLAALMREGRPYTGLLYAGLMITEGAPRVVEFNCRFGDPETQAILPILQGDLLAALWEAADRGAGSAELPALGHDGRVSACVVMAAQGYPGTVRTGAVIRGLAAAAAHPGVIVFQAGTAAQGAEVSTAGGRVLDVVGVGRDLPDALERAYAGVARIGFDGACWRRDIAWRGLRALRKDPLPATDVP